MKQGQQTGQFISYSTKANICLLLQLACELTICYEVYLSAIELMKHRNSNIISKLYDSQLHLLLFDFVRPFAHL